MNKKIKNPRPEKPYINPGIRMTLQEGSANYSQRKPKLPWSFIQRFTSSIVEENAVQELADSLGVELTE